MAVEIIKEVILNEHEDKLCLFKEEGEYSIKNDSQYPHCEFYSVRYLFNTLNGQGHYANNSEFFPLSQLKEAEKAFELRLKENTVTGNNLGMTLAEIYSLNLNQKIYVAIYKDNMYPEDNRIIGVFTSKTSAEESITFVINEYSNPKLPDLHLSNPTYYEIHEMNLNEIYRC